jgi:hypothetical protein
MDVSSSRRHGDPRDRRAPILDHQSLDGATHFLCKGLKAVRTEMSLHVLAYNVRRIMATIGVGRLRQALAT